MSDEPLFFITHGTTLIISGSTEFLFSQRANKRVQHKFTWMLLNERSKRKQHNC